MKEKQFKAGDLVRIKETKQIYEIGNIVITEKGIGYAYNKSEKWNVCFDRLEPVTHLTTKEFIKLVEDMGYELDIRTGVIFIKTKNFREVGWVRTDYECSAAFNFECDKLLLDIFYLYANTPLELREEKEQLYTLELPNTDSCYRYYVRDNYEYLFDDIHDDNGYQTHFTQKEIDELKQGNADLINALKQVPVKENE